MQGRRGDRGDGGTRGPLWGLGGNGGDKFILLHSCLLPSAFFIPLQQVVGGIVTIQTLRLWLVS